MENSGTSQEREMRELFLQLCGEIARHAPILCVSVFGDSASAVFGDWLELRLRPGYYGVFAKGGGLVGSSDKSPFPMTTKNITMVCRHALAEGGGGRGGVGSREGTELALDLMRACQELGIPRWSFNGRCATLMWGESCMARIFNGSTEIRRGGKSGRLDITLGDLGGGRCGETIRRIMAEAEGRFQEQGSIKNT